MDARFLCVYVDRDRVFCKLAQILMCVCFLSRFLTVSKGKKHKTEFVDLGKRGKVSDVSTESKCLGSENAEFALVEKMEKKPLS